VQYIAVRGVRIWYGYVWATYDITGFGLLQHDNCYYSGRGLPWATVYKLTLAGPAVLGLGLGLVLRLGQYGRPS